MGPGCPLTCRKKCQEYFNNERRREIFSKFWSLSDYSRQSAFVGQHVIRIPKKRISNTAINDPPRRKSSLSYILPTGATENKSVCKKMFLHTLGISDMWVTTALKKIDKSVANIVTPDKRGKHSNRVNIIDEEIKQNIREHINLFPRVPSHYTRERTKKEYLEETLSIAKMYRFYTVWATEKSLKVLATERQYRDTV